LRQDPGTKNSKAENTKIYIMKRVHKLLSNIVLDDSYSNIHPGKVQWEQFVERVSVSDIFAFRESQKEIASSIDEN
jgi:hypothetical protein